MKRADTSATHKPVAVACTRLLEFLAPFNAQHHGAKTVFLLRHGVGMSEAETAEFLNITPLSVKQKDERMIHNLLWHWFPNEAKQCFKAYPQCKPRILRQVFWSLVDNSNPTGHAPDRSAAEGR